MVACVVKRMAWLITPALIAATVTNPGTMGNPAASPEVHPIGRCGRAGLERLNTAPLLQVQCPAGLLHMQRQCQSNTLLNDTMCSTQAGTPLQLHDSLQRMLT